MFLAYCRILACNQMKIELTFHIDLSSFLALHGPSVDFLRRHVEAEGKLVDSE
jgi:hypothetical protein